MSIIFNKANGKILFTTELPIRDSELEAVQANKGLDCIDGCVASPDKYYVWGGKVIAIPDSPHKLATWDWGSRLWVMPSTTIVLTEQAKTVRKERDRLLASTDWTQLPDVSDAVRQSWTQYRQQLRDISSQSGFPHTIQWPSVPE